MDVLGAAQGALAAAVFCIWDSGWYLQYKQQKQQQVSRAAVVRLVMPFSVAHPACSAWWLAFSAPSMGAAMVWRTAVDLHAFLLDS
jgi:hypothetical protein